MDESGVDLDWSVGNTVSLIIIFTANIMKVVFINKLANFGLFFI